MMTISDISRQIEEMEAEQCEILTRLESPSVGTTDPVEQLELREAFREIRGQLVSARANLRNAQRRAIKALERWEESAARYR